MIEVKKYSSLFATKINYILDALNVAPLQYGRTKAIEDITKEKSSTVVNWLFNSKLPRDNKRLAIADAIGVSHNYLFDDSINVEDFTKPEIHKDGQCYLVPYIDESEIFELKNKRIFPIKSRLLITFPSFELLIKEYGTNIYITKLNNAIFEPHDKIGSDIIYSEKVIFEDFKLLIHQDSKLNRLVIKKVVQEGSGFYLETIIGDRLVREPLNKSDRFLSVVLTYSTT